MAVFNQIQKQALDTAFAGVFSANGRSQKPSDIFEAIFASVGGVPVITVGAEATNAMTVTLQLKDTFGKDLPGIKKVGWFASATLNGAIVGTAPSGGIAVTTGVAINEAVADKYGEAFTDATGKLVLTVTETSTPDFFINFIIGGAVYSSTILNFV